MSNVIVALIEERDALLDEIEDLHLSIKADERLAASDGKYLTHEEVLKLAETIPYTPQK